MISSIELFFQTALSALKFLEELKSSRTDEFRLGCDGRFELSSVFKSSADSVGEMDSGVPGETDLIEIIE